MTKSRNRFKVLIVGQAPGLRTPPGDPLNGASGRRLASLAGTDFGCFRRRATLCNLLPAFPGKQGKGDRFPLPDARTAAVRLDLAGFDRILLLGRRVAAAFGQDRQFLRWFKLAGIRTAVFPHPSGVSHWWNDPRNVRRARRFIRRLLPPR